MSGQIYNVGIHLSAVNGVSTVLAAISKQMLGLHGSVHQLERGFSSLNKAIVGTVLIGAGAGILKAASTFEKAGEKLVHAETLLNAGLPKGMAAVDMMIARTAAYNEAGKNLNTTFSGNIEHMHDLYNIVQEMHHAADLLPVMNKLDNAFTFATGKSGVEHGQSGSDLAAAARAFELAGRTDPKAIEDIATKYVSSIIGLRGRVNGNELFQAMSSANGMRTLMTDDFIAKGLPTLINVMKGRTGSALSTFENNVYSGVSSSQLQGEAAMKYGLQSKEHAMYSSGRLRGFDSGTGFRSDLMGDPIKWANAFREHLKSDMNINVDDVKEMRHVASEIGKGNVRLKALFEELLLPMTNKQLNKEYANIEKIDQDRIKEGQDNDPGMWRDRVKKQWEGFEEAVGKGLVDPLINNVLKPLTFALRDMGQYAIKNPETIANFAKGMVALGAVFVGAGMVALVAAIGAGGWFIAGMGALAYAFKLIQPGDIKGVVESISAIKKHMDAGDLPEALFANLQKNLSTIWTRISGDFGTMFSKIGEEIKMRVGLLGTYIGNALKFAIESIPAMVMGAISGMASKIGSAIKNALTGSVTAAPGDAGDRENAVKGIGDKLKGRQSFNAPPAGQKVQINTALNVDGQTLARVVSEHMAKNYEHPTTSHYHDGLRGFGSPDGQLATG